MPNKFPCLILSYFQELQSLKCLLSQTLPYQHLLHDKLIQSQGFEYNLDVDGSKSLALDLIPALFHISNFLQIFSFVQGSHLNSPGIPNLLGCTFSPLVRANSILSVLPVLQGNILQSSILFSLLYFNSNQSDNPIIFVFKIYPESYHFSALLPNTLAHATLLLAQIHITVT